MIHYASCRSDFSGADQPTEVERHHSEVVDVDLLQEGFGGLCRKFGRGTGSDDVAQSFPRGASAAERFAYGRDHYGMDAIPRFHACQPHAANSRGAAHQEATIGRAAQMSGTGPNSLTKAARPGARDGCYAGGGPGSSARQDRRGGRPGKWAARGWAIGSAPWVRTGCV